jgi:hypothetical protein
VTDQAGSVQLDAQEGTVALQAVEGDVIADVQEASVAIALPPEQGFTLSADLGEAAVLNSPIDLSGLRNGEGNYNGDVRGGGPLLQVDAMEGTITIR